MSGKQIRLGTRGSKLALAQARLVSRELKILDPDLSFDFVVIKTTGDKKQDQEGPVSRDKKEWIIEIEQALLKGSIDLAVHSAKDVPTEIDPQTLLLPVTKRAVPWDAYILRESRKTAPAQSRLGGYEGSVAFLRLPQRAKVGTSSLRRAMQLKQLRPDLDIVPMRGNVTTRLSKLEESSGLDAIVLAACGLERLNLADKIEGTFPYKEMLPGVNQGILAAQFLRGRIDLAALLNGLVDEETETAFIAERTFIQVLGADCNSAVGVLAQSRAAELVLHGRVLGRDNADLLQETISWSKALPQAAGDELAQRLIKRGAKELL